MSSGWRLPSDRRTWAIVGLVVVGLTLVLWAVLPGASPIKGSDTQESSVGDELPRTPRRGPDLILVPSIGIKAPLRPIELASDGVLTPPADTDAVGWWDESAEPGSRKGQTVVTGHTVSTGGGVMNDLPTIDVGAMVRIRADRTLSDYRVTGVMKLTKEQVAERAQSLFGQGRRQGGQLVMVTCTDYHDGDYDSNIIVWAEPVENDAA
jgi:LPXTG-site transpeptidase (sortase) family protein